MDLSSQRGRRQGRVGKRLVSKDGACTLIHPPSSGLVTILLAGPLGSSPSGQQLKVIPTSLSARGPNLI